MIRCILIEDEPVARIAVEEQLKHIPFVALLASFDNPIPAIAFLLEYEIDLVLSDIKMPGLSGVDFLKSLTHRPLFIFITGNPEYAAQSYELEVFDYIVKPFPFERLLKSLSRAQAFLSAKGDQKTENAGQLTIKENYRNYLVPFEDIYYLEGSKEYIKVVTQEREYLMIDSLKSMENTLPKDSFARVHKSYIINLGFVKALDPDKVIMKGSIKDIPLGATYRDGVYRKLGV